MFDREIIAQALGFLSFALGMIGFYQKDDKKLKIIMTIFSLNHMIHYLLLGSVLSALSALLAALRNGIAIYISSKVFAAVFIILSVSLGGYLADSIWDMWAILGMSIGTYAVFVLKGIQMRIAFLIGATCWLTNNIIVGSIGGTLLEATLICVNLVTITRLLRDQKLAKALKEKALVE